MTADSTSGSPDRIVVLGLDESGAAVVARILTAAGIEREAEQHERSAPDYGVCRWCYDPDPALVTSGSPSWDRTLVIMADRDDSAVGAALARRFTVTAAVGVATWQAYRGTAQHLVAKSRCHLLVDAGVLIAEPEDAIRGFVDQLRESGVTVAAEWTAYMDDIVRAVLELTQLGPVGARDETRPTARSIDLARPSGERMTAIEDTLGRHERAIEQSARTLASLRRRIASQELAVPATTAGQRADDEVHPELARLHADAVAHAAALFNQLSGQLRAAEVERADLVGVIQMYMQDTAALLASRRWRVGDRLGRIFAPALGRRRHELASTRLVRLMRRHSEQPLMSLRAEAPPDLSAPATRSEVHPAPPNAWDLWALPVPRNYTVIVLANVSWGSRQQRPHHIARSFASHGHAVFYVSIGEGQLGDERIVDDGVVEVEFRPTRPYDRYAGIADREVVDEWMIAVETLKLRHGIEDAAVHVHLQSWTPLAWELRHTHGWRIVYDCMDEWEDFPGMGRPLIEIEQELVERSDLVVTTAERLRQKWVSHNPRTVLVRNGVDAAFFTNNCGPSDLLTQTQHPIIGFTGGLAGWVDFALLAAVAFARPEWTFVLVGDVHVQVDDLCGLDRMDNVVLTGLQPYVSMPAFLFSFDVAIIPFVVDRISEAVDPVKFYEYAASGTPIVITCLPEIAVHRHLFYEGVDPSSFELAIERALGEDPALRGERIALAESNTWNDRYQTFDRATRALWPTLSVVVVTYGHLEFTRRCLDTLLSNTTYPSMEVIVVDNGSADGTPKYLRRLCRHDPRVKVVLNADNRGFAAANNQGLAVATGDILVLLNNDTEVTSGWHIPLLQHLEDPTVGLVGPRSNNVGNGARIEVPASYADDREGFVRRLRRDHEGESFDIHMLGMFCVAMRREVYTKVGALDEGYGVGLFEDDDYAERIREADWRVVCARDAFVHHVGQVTFSALIASGEYKEIWKRNLDRFESRWGQWRADHNLVQPGVSD